MSDKDEIKVYTLKGTIVLTPAEIPPAMSGIADQSVYGEAIKAFETKPYPSVLVSIDGKSDKAIASGLKSYLDARKIKSINIATRQRADKLYVYLKKV